jgi:hypothetical protein
VAGIRFDPVVCFRQFAAQLVKQKTQIRSSLRFGGIWPKEKRDPLSRLRDPLVQKEICKQAAHSWRSDSDRFGFAPRKREVPQHAHTEGSLRHPNMVRQIPASWQINGGISPLTASERKDMLERSFQDPATMPFHIENKKGLPI